MSTIAEADRVGFLDEALKQAIINYKLPFRRIRTTLRVFKDVLEYPVPSDFDELSFMDNSGDEYGDRARFKFQSFNEFYENKDYRNDLAEIHDSGDVFLGCRYNPEDASSRELNNCETVGDFSVSGDATAVAKDTVFYKDGNGSMKVTIVSNTTSAVVEYDITSFSDSEYKRKYKFIKIYIGASTVPTSFTIRFGNDSSNYIYTTVTTQFSGQAFVANAWNIIAIDLNEATSVGTISSSAWDYGALILTGAATGTYYIDNITLKEWELLDMWYYSINSVKLAAGTYQEVFYNLDTEAYATDTELIGPKEWANYINHLAMELMAMDKNDSELLESIQSLIKRDEVKIYERWPVVKYFITNKNWRFRTNLSDGYVREYNNDNN